MREAQFLKQNADKWTRIEQDVKHADDPDVLADHFVELTDDLAYAKTFYPDSQSTRYLNSLAQRFHQKIYTNKKEASGRLWNFWQFELPYLFRQYQRQLLYAFLFFAIFTFVGALSAKYDDSFLRLILGDDYVNMTNENLERGDPFGVYKSGDQGSMFIMIAINNIRVSFMTFFFGIFFSVGTVLLLMHNGIMMGSFEYYFFSKGLGMKSILVVFLHGTLEISAIVIAGCAGLIIGNSLLFPKTYSRWHSLTKGARDGMKIVVGLMPVFVVAAFIEGFLTRYSEMPVPVSASIVLLSLSFIIWYFIVYPRQLHRRVRTYGARKNPMDNQNFALWLNRKLSSEK